MQALPRKKVRAASVCLSHSVGGRALGIKKAAFRSLLGASLLRVNF